MKHIVKIMSILVALAAVWAGLIQTSVLPQSYTWLVSFTHFVFQFFYTFWAVYTPVFMISAAYLLHRLAWVLWSLNGWSRSDVFPNLPE